MALLKTLWKIVCKMRIEALTILTTKHNVVVINNEEKEIKQQELHEINMTILTKTKTVKQNHSNS